MPDMSTNKQAGLGQTLLDDLRSSDLKNSLRRDYWELRQFYITKEQEDRLKSMGRFGRFIHINFWLIRSMLLKLTPTRRLLLAFALVFFAFPVIRTGGSDVQINIQTIFLGGIILVFILMLELKDKLLARDELQAGRSVQLALMPEPSPKVGGWDIWLFSRPANDVGGDLVDFISIDSNRYGIALGDVSGKGLSAALFMARLQATLRALAFDFTSLAKLAEKLNAIFYRDSLSGSFASLVYLEIQPENNKIRLVNAGHMPPLIIRKDGLDELDKGSPALGLMPKIDFTEQLYQLEQDEVLVIYSDGLTEARNEIGLFFGDQALRDLLKSVRSKSAQETGKLLLDSVKRFIGAANYYDDLSLVILKAQNN